MRYHICGTLMLAAFLLGGCADDAETTVAAAAEGKTQDEGAEAMVDKVTRTEEEWRELLTENEYKVLREKGTEPAFTGELNDNKEAGTYVCAGCGQPLFSSETKYESGTGWPSFYAPVADQAVAEEEDNTFFMRRTEVLCSRCDGHLGHVFEDGPQPTGLRYCLNSAALDFEPAEEEASKPEAAPKQES